MISKVWNFITTKETLKNELKIYCKDKSIPLDDRWECFIKSDLGNINRFSSKCKVLRDMKLEDPMLFEKYSTNNYEDIIDNLVTDEDQINEIKEYALTAFEKGFIHDW